MAKLRRIPPAKLEENRNFLKALISMGVGRRGHHQACDFFFILTIQYNKKIRVLPLYESGNVVLAGLSCPSWKISCRRLCSAGNMTLIFRQCPLIFGRTTTKPHHATLSEGQAFYYFSIGLFFKLSTSNTNMGVGRGAVVPSWLAKFLFLPLE